jgi:ACS family D-galactonate transporter-like MFS transporter
VVVNYLDRVNVSVSQDALHASFGISVVTFGYLLSAYSWTYALMQLPSGVLLDRFGVRQVGRVGAFLWSVASFGAAAATGIGSFVAARFLLGVGEGPTFPGNAKAIGEWFPQNERSLATAVTDSAAKFSAALGVPFVGLLLIHFGWRWSFAATGLISLLYFVIFYWVYRSPEEDAGLSLAERQLISLGGGVAESAPPNAPGNSLSFLILQPKVLGLALGWGAYNYSFYLLLTWLPSYLKMSLHVDLLHSVIYTSVPWLFATFTDLFVGGWLVDFLISSGWNALLVRRSVMVGGLICGMGILGAAHAQTPLAALCWMIVCVCCME